MRRIAALLGGPTGSGKTDAAVIWAERRGWEILSCDSGQARKGMEIGTAAPDASALARVNHHLVGCLKPADPDSVAAFLERVSKVLGIPGPHLLAVGGTGQYLTALRDGLNAGPAPDPVRRANLEMRLRVEGEDVLRQELKRLRPEITLPDTPRRLVRALERAMDPNPSQWAALPPLAPDAPAFRIALPRAVLHRRIEERLDRMVASGWLEEVAALRAAGLGPGDPGAAVIGFAELFDAVKGEMLPDSVRQRILARTRSYAKRQETWLRHRLQATAVEGSDDPLVVANRLEAVFTNLGGVQENFR